MYFWLHRAIALELGCLLCTWHFCNPYLITLLWLGFCSLQLNAILIDKSSFKSQLKTLSLWRGLLPLLCLYSPPHQSPSPLHQHFCLLYSTHYTRNYLTFLLFICLWSVFLVRMSSHCPPAHTEVSGTSWMLCNYLWMRLQRVRHNWVTEEQKIKKLYITSSQWKNMVHYNHTIFRKNF